ncbi:MAG TPA: hypothetical protein VF727_07445 [Allosphingosinicella sp.]|jgi:hypothetical protein
MPSYRLYFIDGSGAIASVEAFSAGSDGEALRISRHGVLGDAAELWCRDRRIEEPQPADPPPPLPRWLTPPA